MRFAVLSGAYKNAGDFLIVERSIKLLRYVYPSCDIKVYERRKSLKDSLDEINSMDALIMAGGPAYAINIYPNQIPLVDNLADIKIPVYTIGLGWYGNDNSNETLYRHYKFTDETKKLLDRMQNDGTLTCRDWYSVRALKNNGYKKITMTGCPAWYDIENIKNLNVKKTFQYPYKKICISDPARPENFDLSKKIVLYVKDKYPDAEIVYVFHRGINADKNTKTEVAKKYNDFAKQIENMGIKILDISYSAEGFHVYDDCDLHIGMRVHAHIYNLSIRNVSILIEEDGRGSGVNETLGLMSIKAYKTLGIIPKYGSSYVDRATRFIVRHIYGRENINDDMLKELDDYLFMLENSNFKVIEQGYKKQADYFNSMIEHIRSFNKEKK